MCEVGYRLQLSFKGNQTQAAHSIFIFSPHVLCNHCYYLTLLQCDVLVELKRRGKCENLAFCSTVFPTENNNTLHPMTRYSQQPHCRCFYSLRKRKITPVETSYRQYDQYKPGIGCPVFLCYLNFYNWHPHISGKRQYLCIQYLEKSLVVIHSCLTE